MPSPSHADTGSVGSTTRCSPTAAATISLYHSSRLYMLRRSAQRTYHAIGKGFGEDEVPIPIDPQDVVLATPYPVGQGGSCDVYRGNHYRLGDVALKRLRKTNDEVRAKQLEKQFTREVLTWRNLNHENLLPFYGVVELEEHVHLVSPWMEGGDLPAYLRRHSNADRASLVAEAICYLHNNGIVHGDIKGSNIFVSESDETRPLLADFGLSKVAEWSTTSTLKGIGSVHWMSPEVMNGDHRSYASDVYAFGMVIAEVLSGAIPFHKYASSVQIITAVYHKRERPRKEPICSADGLPYGGLWAVAEAC